MKRRLVLSLALVLGILLPAAGFAAPGVLLLADGGKPEWNALVTELAARVDRQRPTELAFWSPTNASVQAAVDRLLQRGVSEIAAVPLFLATLPSDFTSKVQSSVPIRVTGLLNGHSVAAEIVLGRAQEISTNSASEVLVLVSRRSTAGDPRWVPDLQAAAQQLNSTRSFAMVVTMTVPSEGSEPTAEDVSRFRRVLERQIASARRILVVPVLTSYGGVEAAIKEQLQGLPHEVAKSAPMPDDRLVAWILSQAGEK